MRGVESADDNCPVNACRSFPCLLLATALCLLGCGSKEGDGTVSVGGQGAADNTADAGLDASQRGELSDADMGAALDASKSDPNGGFQAFPGLDAGVDPPVEAVDASASPAVDGVGCFADKEGLSLSATAAGGCQQPATIDLSASSYGDVTKVQLPRAPGDLPVGASGKCGLQTATDLVLRVLLPPTADLEAAVDRGGAQAVLRAFEGSSDPCSSVPIACMDETDGSSCTYLRVTQAMLGQSTETMLVLSEYVDSGLPWTLQLRVQDPRTGS